MCHALRRQDELEARLIEEETEKRVEEELAKRVQQLLYERKDEIEAEVLRRVEEAKKVGAVAMVRVGPGIAPLPPPLPPSLPSLCTPPGFVTSQQPQY